MIPPIKPVKPSEPRKPDTTQFFSRTCVIIEQISDDYISLNELNSLISLALKQYLTEEEIKDVDTDIQLHIETICPYDDYAYATISLCFELERDIPEDVVNASLKQYEQDLNHYLPKLTAYEQALKEYARNYDEYQKYLEQSSQNIPEKQMRKLREEYSYLNLTEDQIRLMAQKLSKEN